MLNQCFGSVLLSFKNPPPETPPAHHHHKATGQGGSSTMEAALVPHPHGVSRLFGQKGPKPTGSILEKKGPVRKKKGTNKSRRKVGGGGYRMEREDLPGDGLLLSRRGSRHGNHSARALQ